MWWIGEGRGKVLGVVRRGREDSDLSVGNTTLFIRVKQELG